METAFLRSFVEVAHSRHVGRAAEALGIAQPSVTYQIGKLEELFGTPLFDRGPRGMTLTAAGAVLLEEARPILRRLHDLQELVQAAGAGTRGMLRVGFVSGAILSGVASAIVRKYRADYPDVRVRMRALVPNPLIALLREGELDVAVFGSHHEESAFVSEPLADERFVLALPADHRFAGRRTVKYQELAGETIVTLSRAAAPDMFSQIFAILLKYGVIAENIEEAMSEDSVIGLVAAGSGVAIVPDSWAAIQISGVVIKPLAPAGHATSISIFRRADNSSLLVRAFIDIARKT